MKGSRPAELVAGSSNGAVFSAPARERALGIVRRAADAGIDKFATARQGDGESRIGEALEGRKTVRTITALGGFEDVPAHAIASVVRAKVDESIERSLAALRRDKLDCILLPRAQYRTAWRGALWERLIELLEDGIVLSLGVSVQTPAEALGALSCADVQHIQLPFNILDWRWRSAGVIDRLSERSSVTVHARNIFLDGLLTAETAAAWPRLPGLAAHGVMDWLEETARFYGRDGVADLCLAFVRGQHWIDGVVVDMETEEQLETNLRLAICPPLAADACADIEATRPRVALALLDPAQWPRK
jgi:aryl-alcohol dehydrogenase-like predicted oxidoreductase